MRYMRDNLPDTYGFLELQDKIMEISVDVDKFCTQHEIDYCLMGGSALGAKRHGGFIPWDDDLDIFMTPDQYERFREKFRSNGDHEKYYLQEWGACDGMVTIAKIRMNGTTYLESAYANWDIHHGIYIDIFILHTCPNHRLQQLHQCFWAKYVIMKGLANRGYSRRGGMIAVVLKFMALLPEHFLIRHGLKQVYRYRNQKTDFYCNFLGKAVFSNAIYKRVYFEKTTYAPFEKVRLRVPVGLHEFLSERFGDYMQMPSEERIKWEQHAQSWDFDQQLKVTDEYKDEIHLI